MIEIKCPACNEYHTNPEAYYPDCKKKMAVKDESGNAASPDFIAIDFETGNAKRVRACALGFAKVVSGRIIDSERPTPG